MSETVELTSTNSHVLALSCSGQDLVSLFSRKVVGQSTATNIIVPDVYMYQSGLAPAGRAAGAFLLLCPTGTGKSRTVEAIRGRVFQTRAAVN
jgi:ATP-dependent Clp protease ATP-binding subunit ClpA